MGGGRCTKAGCMCYAGFFDYDGSPISSGFPEDNLWWSLTSAEQNEIRREMARFRYQHLKKFKIDAYIFENFSAQTVKMV